MKKANPQHRYHLTWQERRRIKTLALKGCGPTAISRILHVTRNTVSLALCSMGLPTRPRVDEAKVLELLRANMDRKRVARTSHVSIRAVKRIGKQHHIRRKRDPLGAKRARIEADIRARRNPAVVIAREYRVPYRRVLQLAHEIHGKGRFLGGQTEPPFASYYPQVQEHVEKYVQRSLVPPTLDSSEESLFLLDLILRMTFDGKLPDDHVQFAELVTEWCLRQIPPATWNAIGEITQRLVKHSLALDFLAAAETLRRAQQTSERATWMN